MLLTQRGAQDKAPDTVFVSVLSVSIGVSLYGWPCPCVFMTLHGTHAYQKHMLVVKLAAGFTWGKRAVPA